MKISCKSYNKGIEKISYKVICPVEVALYLISKNKIELD